MKAHFSLLISALLMILAVSCSTTQRVTVLWGHQGQDGTYIVDSLTKDQYKKYTMYTPNINIHHAYTIGPVMSGDGKVLMPIVEGDSLSLASAFPTVAKSITSYHNFRLYGEISAIGIIFNGSPKKKGQYVGSSIVCTGDRW